MLDSVSPIIEAIEQGDRQRARQLLRPLLQNPTADVWYAASFVYDQPVEQMQCLKRALKLDPLHGDSRRRLKLPQQGELAPPPAAKLELPSLDALVKYAPPAPTRKSVWKQRRKQRRRNWTLIGISGSVLLSLSASYFVLTVLGSPIPAQIRSLLSGSQPANQTEGTPVFGQPSNANVPAGASGGENNPQPATSSNTTFVRPSQSKRIEYEKPLSDVLDAGFAHEYTFMAIPGDEVAIGIQFFSPTAQNVSPNVAVLNPLDANAEANCERDRIFADDSGITFICTINEAGQWKIQLLGRQGDSTGVYVITIDRF